MKAAIIAVTLISLCVGYIARDTLGADDAVSAIPILMFDQVMTCSKSGPLSVEGIPIARYNDATPTEFVACEITGFGLWTHGITIEVNGAPTFIAQQPWEQIR